MNKTILTFSLLILTYLSNAQTFTFTEFPIYQGAASSYPRNFHIIGGDKLLFTAQDSAHGREYWVTDGTPANTTILKDIFPGKIGGPYNNSIMLNNKLLFTANDSIHGAELWITDGTPNGTQLVKDINVGPNSSIPTDFIFYNGKVLFNANDSIHGNELWITDGTEAGTQFVKDIYVGDTSSAIFNKIMFNGKVYFQAISDKKHDVWVTDGTPNGTKHIPGILTGESLSFYKAALGKIFMLQYTLDKYKEIWVTDGTPSGTQLLKEVVPGKQGTIALNTAEYKGKLLIYAATTSGHDWSYLYITDGTPNGTKELHAFRQDSPQLINFCEFDGKMYFNALDDDATTISKLNLWETDGTVAGTKVVKNLNDYFFGTISDPALMTKYNDYLYLSSVHLGKGRQIIRTDGTDSGTVLITHPVYTRQDPVYVEDMIVFDSSIYFSARYAAGYELWSLKDTSTRPKRDTTNNTHILSQKKLSFNVYPNTNSGRFDVDFGRNIEQDGLLEVYDYSGRMIHKETIIKNNSHMKVDIGNVTDGIYFLHLNIGTSSATSSILVVN